jgi:hypothetical protein
MIEAFVAIEILAIEVALYQNPATFNDYIYNC